MLLLMTMMHSEKVRCALEFVGTKRIIPINRISENYDQKSCRDTMVAV